MITILPSHKNIWENVVEGYVFLMTENFVSDADLKTLARAGKEYHLDIKDVLEKHFFSGKKGESFVLTSTHKKKLIQYLFIGLGSLNGQPHISREILRRSICTAVHIIKKHNLKTAVLELPEHKLFGITTAELAKQIAIAAIMADYEFSTFKTEKKDNRWSGKLFLVLDQTKTSTDAIAEGILIGQSTTLARHWADLPGNIMTPTELAKQAQSIAQQNNLKYTAFNRDKALSLGMGGFCAVDAGSEQDGKFITLEYATKTKNAPTIALVGKGVCFDSGGLSLKPSSSMEGMKFDMSGAAAVIATMSVIAQLKPKINVIALAPLVENMPSGKAARQDDIITFMNGKTAEIKNTDAEGRLILADALCYAEKFYKPTVMIDIATLTGACLYSLGHFYSGLMTRDEQLSNDLQAAGQLTGDNVWPLPLGEDFKDAIKSNVADISNTGSPAYLGGTVTAAHFLENFVITSRWAHLDIAGTAHDVPGINYLGRGATGAGVRLLVEFIMSFKK